MIRDYESGALRHFSWWANEARLRTFAAAGKAGKTIVKIELEVLDASALGSIMSALQEASTPFKPAPQERAPRSALPRAAKALPAPLLQLTDGRKA